LVLSVVTWPLTVLYYLFLLFRKFDVVAKDLKRKRLLRSSALQVLYPHMVFLSIWLALVPVAMNIVVHFRGNEQWFFDFVATMVIIAAGLKHLLHLIGSTTTQGILRRAKAPVAVNYVTIVACDLVALILSYNIVLAALEGGTPDLVGVKDIYDRLKGFSDVFNLVLDRPTKPIDYALGLSGMLWLIALARDMLNLRGYQRTTSDLCARGFILALCGFDADARAEIERLSPELDTDIKILAEAHALLGDLRQSLRLTKRFVRRRAEFGNDRDVEDMANAILLVSEKFYHADETERISGAIAFLEEHGLDPLQLVFAAIQKGPAGFAEALKADGQPDRLLLPKAYVYWEVGDRRDGLLALNRLEVLDSAKADEGEAEEDKPLDAHDACALAVFLMMLEGLATEEELREEVDKWLAKSAGSVRTAIEAEERFVALFSLCWILMVAAERLKGRVADVGPVLGLADVALARIEWTPLTDDFSKDLKAFHSQLKPEKALPAAANIGAATTIGPEEVAAQNA
jgi:hypothetical protein